MLLINRTLHENMADMAAKNNGEEKPTAVVNITVGRLGVFFGSFNGKLPRFILKEDDWLKKNLLLDFMSSYNRKCFMFPVVQKMPLRKHMNRHKRSLFS